MRALRVQSLWRWRRKTIRLNITIYSLERPESSRNTVETDYLYQYETTLFVEYRPDCFVIGLGNQVLGRIYHDLWTANSGDRIF